MAVSVRCAGAVHRTAGQELSRVVSSLYICLASGELNSRGRRERHARRIPARNAGLDWAHPCFSGLQLERPDRDAGTTLVEV